MFKFKCLFSFILVLLLSVFSIYSQNTGCEVISYIEHCAIRDNKLIKIDTVIIQINDRTGERYTDIAIPYSKNIKISDLKAWIEDASGGIVRKLKNSEITDKSYISDYSLYEDDFVKTFTLKHNEYPYRIIYTYQTSCKQYITISFNPIVYYKVPTRNARFSLVVPKGFSFQKYSNNISEPKTENIGYETHYTWQTSYLKPIHDELFTPAAQEVLPCLYIIPKNFIYGVEGSSENWVSFGNWVYRLIQGLDDLPVKEKNIVEQLIKGVIDKREIVKILYHYLQDHTRYINVSIDIGGLKPYPASYVSENKYGDCKALTNYMKALLKFAGIQSYYTVIYGGDEPSKVLEQIPGPQYFNHVILTIPLENDTIWLENTSNICPFSYVGSFIQNRKALLVDENKSRLIHIPDQKAQDVLISRKINVAFNATGDASIDILANMKGVGFEWFNSLNSGVNDTQKDEVVRNHLNYGNFDLVNWMLNKKDRDSKCIQLELKMNFYKYLKSIGDEHYSTLVPMDIPTFENPKDRKLPLEITYPIYKIDTLVIKAPVGFGVKAKPVDVNIATPYGNYGLIFNEQADAIQIIRKFELYPNAFDLGHYSDFYKFIATAREADKTKVVFKRK